MKLDPALLEYFHQLNEVLTEAVSAYRAQVRFKEFMAEKMLNEEDDKSDSSCSD